MDRLYARELPADLQGDERTLVPVDGKCSELLKRLNGELASVDELESKLKALGSSYRGRVESVPLLTSEPLEAYDVSVERIGLMRSAVLGSLHELALFSGSEQHVVATRRRIEQLGTAGREGQVRAAAEFLYALEWEPSMGELPNSQRLTDLLARLATFRDGSDDVDTFCRHAESVVNGYEAVTTRQWALFGGLPKELKPGVYDPQGGIWANLVLMTHVLRLYFLRHTIDGLTDKAVAVGRVLKRRMKFRPQSQNGLYFFHLGDLLEQSLCYEEAESCFKLFHDAGIDQYRDFLDNRPANPMDRYLQLASRDKELAVLTVDTSLLSGLSGTAKEGVQGLKDKEVTQRIERYTQDSVHYADAIPILRATQTQRVDARKEPITLREVFAYLTEVGIPRRGVSNDLRLSIEKFCEVIGSERRVTDCIHIEPRVDRGGMQLLEGQHYVLLVSQTGTSCDLGFYHILKLKVNRATPVRSFNERISSKCIALKEKHDLESSNRVELVRAMVFDAIADLAGKLTPYVSHAAPRAPEPEAPARRAPEPRPGDQVSPWE